MHLSANVIVIKYLKIVMISFMQHRYFTMPSKSGSNHISKKNEYNIHTATIILYKGKSKNI